MVTIPESNIIYRDANGVIRKWIDQKTGAVMEHECEEFVSQCCGVEAVEETDCCGRCHEHTGFECIKCEEMNDG